MKKLDPALLALIAASYVCLFVLGGLFGIKNWQPFAFLRQGFIDASTLMQESWQHRPALLAQNKYEGNGVTIHDPKMAAAGLTLLQGTLPGGPQIRLIDMQGKELHRWIVDFFSLWPDPDHLIEEMIPKSTLNYHTQGVALFPDGSVVFNIGDKGTAKLDKCGKVLWTLDRMTHHSVTPTSDGGFWIPANRSIDNIPPSRLFRGVSKEELKQLAKSSFHGYENLILRVNSEGEVIREFSILQSLIDGGFESLLHDVTMIKKTDPTHINDIAVVTKALADKLPGVDVGDILVSIRQANMLAILDQRRGTIKWHYRGGWIRQHDPDITADGNIVVFDNGTWDFSFQLPHGSSLVMLDPADSARTVLYPKKQKQHFRTDILGEQQQLHNGNYLITQSRKGRVFEVTSEGETVWEYVLPYDETHASLIAIARRYPKEYFTVADWSCP